MKIMGNFTILKNKKIAEGIYKMILAAPEIAEECVPGQFVNLYLDDGASLLPRPISICQVDKSKSLITLVYRVVGTGTTRFSGLYVGDSVRVMGPIGNGFPVNITGGAVLIGGGIGIPPLLGLAEELRTRGCTDITAYLGYRDSETFLADVFTEAGARVVIVTDDGSTGYKGNAVECFAAASISDATVYACGPKPMLKALSALAAERGFTDRLYLSMEERMACGLGACYGCVVKTASGDGFIYKRACEEGPVFRAGDLII